MIAFLINLTLRNKHVPFGKLSLLLHSQLFNSWAMYKFKTKLLYNEKELFCAKTELLNFQVTLLLAKLIIAVSGLE